MTEASGGKQFPLVVFRASLRTQDDQSSQHNCTSSPLPWRRYGNNAVSQTNSTNDHRGQPAQPDLPSNSDSLTATGLRTKPCCIRSWISQQYDFIKNTVRNFSSREPKAPGLVDTKQTGEMPQIGVVNGRVAEK